MVLALPVSEDRVWISVFYRVIYNFGRVFTYTILGGIAGAVAALFSLQVLQARVAQIAGALLILLALLQLLPHIHLGFLSRAHAFIARTIAPLLRNAGRGRFFLLGMLNGILPCGMVAAALLVSIAAETWLSGIAYMAVFGAGTFPLMLLASVYGMEVDQTQQRRLKRVLDGAVATIAGAQTKAGGWYYFPGSNDDEGSVTITQMQALRAARMASIVTDKRTIDRGVDYV
ncbi:MAG TPA: sulfite exporter TauE/SafE family protein, partial [Turneriella sp.]|nr:sulfite exporter TauE/SafE family protein [Turneriella sp.]